MTGLSLLETSFSGCDSCEVSGYFSPAPYLSSATCTPRREAGVQPDNHASAILRASSLRVIIQQEVAAMKQEIADEMKAELGENRSRVGFLNDEMKAELGEQRSRLGSLDNKIHDHDQHISQLDKQITTKLEQDQLSRWMSCSSIKEITGELRNLVEDQAAIIEVLQARLLAQDKCILTTRACGTKSACGANFLHFWQWLISWSCCGASQHGSYTSFADDVGDDEDIGIATPLSQRQSTPILTAQQASARYAAGMSRFSITVPPDDLTL